MGARRSFVVVNCLRGGVWCCASSRRGDDFCSGGRTDQLKLQ